MTPQDKLKFLVLKKADYLADEEGLFAPAYGEPVGEKWEALQEDDNYWDAMSETRCGEVETSLPSGYSRHYESKAVAAQLPDGSWVGWTYWYGGGKHGEPESVDWIEDAYDVTCAEEEKTVVVRTFAAAAPLASGEPAGKEGA